MRTIPGILPKIAPGVKQIYFSSDLYRKFFMISSTYTWKDITGRLLMIPIGIIPELLQRIAPEILPGIAPTISSGVEGVEGVLQEITSGYLKKKKNNYMD